MNQHYYTILIQWSNIDQCFVVSLPEWGPYCHTHGATYEEALKNAQAVLELLIDSTLRLRSVHRFSRGQIFTHTSNFGKNFTGSLKI